jgi:putative PIN family toxin of toxin-antitoxin system
MPFESNEDMPRRGSLRLVVDTNVLISSLLSVGMMALLRHVVKHHTLLFSATQLDEFKRVVIRPKLKGRILPQHQEELLEALEHDGSLVDVVSKVVVCRDPDDDHLLAMCKDGSADILVTGDEDLLVLKKFGKTRIQSPAEFLRNHP